MYDSAVLYYDGEHSDSSGTILARQFPVSTLVTPSCCVSPGGKCIPSNLYWTALSWQSLHFSVDDPFYYSYQFQSGGTDKTATFRAQAFGDLTCDTVLSTYERIGSVDAGGNVVPSPGLHIVNDLE
jgi:hypothetical protein